MRGDRQVQRGEDVVSGPIAIDIRSHRHTLCALSDDGKSGLVGGMQRLRRRASLEQAEIVDRRREIPVFTSKTGNDRGNLGMRMKWKCHTQPAVFGSLPG